MPKISAEEVRVALRSHECVCIDVDSTACTDEGIDVLAEAAGCGQEVADWTRKAMGGNVTFQESFAARLNIIKPTTDLISRVVARGPSLTPGVKEFVEQLHALDKKVYLISGGIRDLVAPVADALSIPRDRIFANVLHFNDAGEYTHFDETQPTSRSGGKPEAIHAIKQRPGHDRVVMIGDGVTDMEARPPADLFIGFGGNVVREKVQAGCDFFATDFDMLTTMLKEQ
ncbi:phosphoserine phosphatase [Salpingoeca rosetta]|uniref:phosphoserine phosphatase n=1 Tax=Salpingoeca rosetta (strain ATCC 50818 / BSB-021) TaxID=946362 RepID=F2UF47_SALR5|nr:phosphoserine phosphatase [Salpingoeca rosetta]EGD75247.1 phosphoserine phosphatase [Salpingoeca rosetta]|eukprot:XP_004992300.1 phosphoserine phosphatase [Salpingoeca rosetta]